jgi:hypothetical protein
MHSGPAVACHDRRVPSTGTCSTVQAPHIAHVVSEPVKASSVTTRTRAPWIRCSDSLPDVK